MEVMGWIGSILLAICALPNVIMAYRTKECNLYWSTLLLWFLGEVLTFIPIMFSIKSPFLIFNYGFNIISLIYLIYIKL